MLRSGFVLCLAATLSSPAARAAAELVVAPKPSAECLTVDNAYARAPLMRVSGPAGAKVHLQDKASACSPGALCPWRRAGYVVAGDEVLASAPVKGFRCVYAGSQGRLTAGFVPEAWLSPVGTAKSITPDWLVGRWSDGSNLVIISKKHGDLAADGDGVWPGRNFTGPPGPHIGSFHGAPKIAGAAVSVVDDECHVDGRRRGPFLILSDNEECGGVNVRFMGIYVSGSTLKP